MRRLLLFFSMLVCVALSAMAESVITITTSKAYGDTFVFYPMPQAEGTISQKAPSRSIGETETKSIIS